MKGGSACSVASVLGLSPAMLSTWLKMAKASDLVSDHAGDEEDIRHGTITLLRWSRRRG